MSDNPERLAGGEPQLLGQRNRIVVCEEHVVDFLYQRGCRYGYIALIDFDNRVVAAFGRALEPQRREVEAVGIFGGIDSEPLGQRVGFAAVGVADHGPHVFEVADFGRIVRRVVIHRYGGCVGACVDSFDCAAEGAYVARSGTRRALQACRDGARGALPFEDALGFVADVEGCRGDGIAGARGH